ncbi:MAG: oligosaccharide flippase family protein [Planctomycetes bacterium]|nr:oligosaccharide flippase family protein [Planctomycetota bacterium]
MSQLKRNVLANIVGKVWVTGLGLAVIPVQVKILGMEAYGLLGFVASLQVLFTMLDLGLSATVTREVAIDPSRDRRQARELVQTLATAYWVIGVIVGGILFVCAGWLARDWLHFKELPAEVGVSAFRIMAVATALRWPVALYSGILAGVQRFGVLNALEAGTTTMRHVGGLGVLLVWRDLHALLVWILLTSLVEICAYVVVAMRALPGLGLRPRLSFLVIRPVWRFALGMNLITVLSALLTQTDRLILPNVLSVEALGFYTIAWSAAQLLSRIPTLVNSAVYPVFAGAWARGELQGLRLAYDRATQVVLCLTALPALALVFFGHDLLRVWISVETADRAAGSLRLLTIGFLLNAMMTLPYTVAIAAGRPRVPNIVNLIILPIYVPALYVATQRWGPIGAASAWVGLNAYYVLSLLPAVHARMLQRGVTGWALVKAGPFALLATAAMAAAWALAPAGDAARLALAAAGAVLYFAACAALMKLRPRDLLRVSAPTNERGT